MQFSGTLSLFDECPEFAAIEKKDVFFQFVHLHHSCILENGCNNKTTEKLKGVPL